MEAIRSFVASIPSRGEWLGPLLIAAVTGLWTLYQVHSTNTDVHVQLIQDLNNRLSVVETKQTLDETNMDKKVDHIQSQVDRLVSWALGDKPR